MIHTKSKSKKKMVCCAIAQPKVLGFPISLNVIQKVFKVSNWDSPDLWTLVSLSAVAGFLLLWDFTDNPTNLCCLQETTLSKFLSSESLRWRVQLLKMWVVFNSNFYSAHQYLSWRPKSLLDVFCRDKRIERGLVDGTNSAGAKETLFVDLTLSPTILLVVWVVWTLYRHFLEQAQKLVQVDALETLCNTL